MTLSVRGKGSKATLVATLTDEDSGDGIAGAPVSFFADGVEIGEVQTDDLGSAELRLPARYRGGHHDYAGRFGGDTYYLGSEATAST